MNYPILIRDASESRRPFAEILSRLARTIFFASACTFLAGCGCGDVPWQRQATITQFVTTGDPTPGQPFKIDASRLPPDWGAVRIKHSKDPCGSPVTRIIVPGGHGIRVILVPPTQPIGVSRVPRIAPIHGTVINVDQDQAIIAIDTPSGRTHTVRPAPAPATAERPGIWAVAGPDAAGLVAFVEEHFPTPSHALKVIRLDGSQERTVFEHQGDPIWKRAVGKHMAISPTGGRVALVGQMHGVQMPGALLDEGPLEVWDIARGTNVTCGQVLDEGIAWFPDGHRLACVRLLPRNGLPPSTSPEDGFGKLFAHWDRVPVICVVDVDTEAACPVCQGVDPVISTEGDALLVADFPTEAFEPGGVDPEQFFRNLAPMQLVGAIHQVILLLSMPGRTHDAAALPAIVEGMLARESSWLQGAIGNAGDFKAVAEHLAGKLGEGLNMENIPAAGGFTDGARLNLRNALFFCWTALPEPRRTSAEAERIVRLAIARRFALIEDIRQELAAK